MNNELIFTIFIDLIIIQNFTIAILIFLSLIFANNKIINLRNKSRQILNLFRQAMKLVGEQASRSGIFEPATKQKVNRIIELPDKQQIFQYFELKKKQNTSEKTADFYTYERFHTVVEQIYNGDLEVESVSHNISDLLAKQSSPNQQKQKQIKQKKQRIVEQLSLLDYQLSKNKTRNSSLLKGTNKISQSLNISRISSSLQNEQQVASVNGSIAGKLILSKDEHTKFMLKLNQQRFEREKAFKILKQKQQSRVKKDQQEIKLIEEQRKEEERLRKIQDIQDKLKKRKEEHQTLLQVKKQTDKRVNQVRGKTFLHEQIAQKYQLNIKLPLLQQRKKLLQQKRQLAKAYNVDELNNHQKSYLQARQTILKRSLSKQPSRQKYHPPSKSSKLTALLQQQKIDQQKKMAEKKQVIEQKVQRQQNYGVYLKQKFRQLKTDKTKQQQIKSRIQYDNRKKDIDLDHYLIGLKYLQQSKKLKKKKQDKEEAKINPETVKALSEKTIQDSRVSNQMRSNTLIKKRQQKIEKLIQDDGTQELQKIARLKMETEKINQAFRLKEQMLKHGYSQKIQDQAVELLLTSIQAKMGIIDICKQQKKS